MFKGLKRFMKRIEANFPTKDKANFEEILKEFKVNLKWI